jgi:hypothetical protein
MAEDKHESAKSFDPFEPFRDMRDAYLDAMSKAMIETVNSEKYAQATGSMLDLNLTASAPFREAMEKSMLQAMQMLAVPSRKDTTDLAERLTHIEMRLDDMDANLDQIVRQLGTVHKVQGKAMHRREKRTVRRA